MSIDINSLSARELETLISKAKKRKTTLAKRKPIGQVRRKLEQQAKAEGYTLEELFGTAGGGTSATATRSTGRVAKKARKLGKVPPKYRNPENPEETWTGRGRQPRWLAALTAEGRQVEAFLIEKKDEMPASPAFHVVPLSRLRGEGIRLRATGSRIPERPRALARAGGAKQVRSRAGVRGLFCRSAKSPSSALRAPSPASGRRE